MSHDDGNIRVDTRRLLSVCLSLTRAACQTIRKVQEDREKQGDSALGATMKDETDPRTYLTLADTQAQDLIWRGLRKHFGMELNIVGEEETESSEQVSNDQDKFPVTDPLEDEFDIPEELHSLVLSDITMFIDPVDGTREFVEGRLGAVQCLVGVSYRGRAVAGVVGLPFYTGAVQDDQSSILLLCGVVGSTSGVRGLPISSSPAGEGELVLTTSVDLVDLENKGGSQPASLVVTRDMVRNYCHTSRLLPAGACGNKCLMVCMGTADCALMNLSCSLWDTCATEALVRAAGGEMTTLLGWTIDHVRRDDTNKETYKNRYGVFVTGKNFATKADMSHKKFMESRVTPQPAVLALLHPDGVIGPTGKDLTVDLLRNIKDGRVITARELGKDLGVESVTSYYALETETIRYKQSEACRLRTNTGHSAFLKRIVLRELPSAIEKAQLFPFKLARDLQANCNESYFLGRQLVAQFNDLDIEDRGGLTLGQAYNCQAIVFKDLPLDSKFYVLLRDFSEEDGWRQVVQLNMDETKATLRAIARFHAYFWLEGQTTNQQMASGLWKVATYWDLAKQPREQLDGISLTVRRVIRELLGDQILQEDLKDYGGMLAKHAEYLDRQVHGGEKQTVIHGDAKSANFFYKTGKSGELEVGMIDFQWTGLGLCATDLAYALWAGPCAEVTDSEQFLVEYYHQHLTAYLRGQPQTQHITLDLDTFKQQYRMAFLDLCRVIMADHWRVITLGTLRKRAALPDINRKVFNAYNKDENVARRLLLRFMTEMNKLSEDFGDDKSNE